MILSPVTLLSLIQPLPSPSSPLKTPHTKSVKHLQKLKKIFLKFPLINLSSLLSILLLLFLFLYRSLTNNPSLSYFTPLSPPYVVYTIGGQF
jgi:hypothetical protein